MTVHLGQKKKKRVTFLIPNRNLGMETERFFAAFEAKQNQRGERNHTDKWFFIKWYLSV